MAQYVGADLGNTTSAIAYYGNDGARLIPLVNNARSIPSAVAFTPDGVIVGDEALKFGGSNPDALFTSFKRNMGALWNDDEHQGDRTEPDAQGRLAYRAPDGMLYLPQELSAFVLNVLLDAAEDHLSERPTMAVITVPADSNALFRAATEEAGHIAGLTSVTIKDEPTAAALSAGADLKKTARLFVVDLGGGTCDVSCVQVGKGLCTPLTEPSGNRRLGGDDWDAMLADWLMSQWRSKHPDDTLPDSAPGRRVLARKAEEAKKALSTRDTTQVIWVDASRTPDGKDLPMREDIDKPLFDALTADLRKLVIKYCADAVKKVQEKDPNFHVKDISSLVLVGGMTRVRSVRDDVEAFFGKRARKDVVPEEAVALGGAIWAAIIEGRKTDTTVVERSNHALCIETLNDVPAIIIPAGSDFPCSATSWISNKSDKQGLLSIRVLEKSATQFKASQCDLLASTDLPIDDPGLAKTARLKVNFHLDESGRPSVWTDQGVIYGRPPQ